MRYDVIVVGAGPAGSTTARECASHGLSVLMLDKAEFPRDKPCGGGVTIRAANLLPFDLTSVTERTAKGLHFSFRQGNGFNRTSEHDLVYLTQRLKLDQLLVEKAVESGASLRERCFIRSVERQPTRVVVRANGCAFEGSVLVGADGANGVTARLSGLKVRLAQGIAMEGNITPRGRFPSEWENVVGLDIGCTPGGYGWLFPKSDHINIGMGAWRHFGPSLKESLGRLVRYYGFEPADIWGLRGHHMPVRLPGSALMDGNILLVGDAAGLLDPFTGEGIHSAIWSGQAAARAISAYIASKSDNLEEYRTDVEEGLGLDLKVSRQYQDLFHLTPRFYMWVAKNTSVLWGLTCRLMRGDQTYCGVMKNHRKLETAVELISDLVRVTPFLQRRSGMKEPGPPQRFFLSGAHHRQRRQ
ncbi:MAG: geranylgeranyl reductase family protein [Chloroflexi bacterium]|nr:geranylgeranyl reductase family protein [Chloroflexota bacterium]